MKRLIILFLALFLVPALTGCQENNDSKGPVEYPTNIPQAYLEYPQTSNLTEYIDYSNFALEDVVTEYNEQKWFYNKLADLRLPDPSIFVENGVYYITGTTDRTGSKTIDCYTTTDFSNFEHYPNIYTATPDSWESTTESAMFAPEMFKYEDSYYISYSNKSAKNGRRYISLVKSDSPTGPYLPIQENNSLGEYIDGYEAPLFTHNDQLGLDVLDQHYYIDDDGSIYVYYSVYHSNNCQYIVGVKMIDLLTPDWSTYKKLVYPGALSPETASFKPLGWENYTSAFPVAEGPYMIKSPVNGKYYLTYSVNHYPDRYYTVCYAVSDTPLGDFTKPYTAEDKANNRQWTNLVFGYAGPLRGDVFDDWGGFNSGTAHHCFFKIGDQYMIGFHAHINRKDGGRAVGIDYLHFNEEGVPYGEGPTHSLQFQPEAISGYKNIAMDAKISIKNITQSWNLNDNYIVVHHHLKHHYEGNEAILGAGHSYILLEFDQEYLIGGISIYNSSKYEKLVYEIEYINLFNDNVIYNVQYPMAYFSDLKEFANPVGAFNVELNDVKTNKVLICFNLESEAQLNEIRVYGKKA